jgi:hypothetical protein
VKQALRTSRFTSVSLKYVSGWDPKLPLRDFFFISLGWGERVHLARRQLVGLLYQPQDCGAVGGMGIGRGN